MRHTLPALAACAALLALGLAAAPPAHAQSLTLGSGANVTVDGTGTHGTINNTTTSYTDSDNPYAVLAQGTAAFTLGTGGTLTAGNSDIGLYANGRGPITVTGGTVTAGNSGFALFANSSNPITISGGTFTAQTAGYGLYATATSTVTLTGGTVTAGRFGYGLYASGSGSINLYGMFDGLTPGETEALPSDPTNGYASSFVGTLENNTSPQTFTYDNYAAITLHDIAAAPEPSQWAAFAIGILGLGALALKARRRAAA